MDDWKSRLVLESMLPHFNMAGNRQEPRRLQESGTSKRRQEGDNFHFTGMADGGYPNKIKRPCLEDVTLSMGPGAHPTLSTELQMPTLTMNPSSADLGVAGQSLLLENNPLDSNAVNSSAMGSPFGVSSTADTGLKGHAIPYYEKNNNMPAVDQELQDLLEELTKIQEPSSNDLDLEKILGNKPEEPLVLHHSQAPLGPPAKLPVQMPHMESLGSSKEYASSCSQATGTSLPVLPSSTGISYPIPPTSKQIVSPSSSTAQAQVKNQAQTMLPVTLPPLSVPQWHHAHQLKALAASKQGSATKQHGSNRSWSSLPTPGLSPPYLPVPSPHPPPTQPPPPPFSPQNFIAPCMSSNSLSGSAAQSSPNALLSSMAPSSTANLGPTLPYAPAKLPALPHNQKPQFSPQSSILANLVSSSVKSPQGHLLSALPTSTPGPSPPYRPENLSSPGLPQQSFTPQYSLIRSLTPTSSLLSQQQQQQQQQQQHQQQHQHQHQQQQQQQANSIFKPMTSSQQSKTLSMIMQQGLASSSPEAPEPFTFSNTKPLSHFVSEPSPQKMASMPASSRQSSLFHYLPQATPAHVPSATASSTAILQFQQQQQQQQQQHHQQQHHQQQQHQQQQQQHHHQQQQQQPDQSSFLLQQIMQQPQRFQRMVASDSMPTLPGQGCCHRCAWTTAALWLEHQHQQWNALNSTHGHAPPSNLTHVDKACKLGEARPPQVSLGRQPPSRQALGSESFLPGSSFAHELARVTSSYGTSEAAPWGSWDPKAWRQVPAPLLPSCDAAAREAEIRSYGNDP
ncbi:mastermind-like domain-containing protein 1 isoform X1 [Chionomys nivalis]|uniref:mastermind-like domain-containing protein 1 isoform X1 n=1 Tax=Chionomys nivalis TaxID=269649 RepID=UPI00259AA98D|nr:mastermind-like domain-containing protein 1 isoform X1 [Chionomys nivalis]XP_057615907.1 mastermind-like domain-containing protein 1 isoform X1 [Chionomys nivalis]XP_057615908.1 mastermind-like domain-containing protein 1 isoform X1 [Chionomys nivalis]